MKITVTNLHKKINDEYILKNINYTFDQSKIYGLYGINGSGKTMFLKILCGLVPSSTGEIKFNEKVLGKKINISNDVTVAFTDVKLISDMTAAQNLRYINPKVTKTEIEEVLKIVKLQNSKKKIKKYSLGMIQRLNIAQSLLKECDVIIWDEPTNGLDTEGRELIKDIIRKKRNEGKLIIFTSHDKEDILSISDIVLHLNNGTLEEKRY